MCLRHWSDFLVCGFLYWWGGVCGKVVNLKRRPRCLVVWMNAYNLTSKGFVKMMLLIEDLVLSALLEKTPYCLSLNFNPVKHPHFQTHVLQKWWHGLEKVSWWQTSQTLCNQTVQINIPNGTVAHHSQLQGDCDETKKKIKNLVPILLCLSKSTVAWVVAPLCLFKEWIKQYVFCSTPRRILSHCFGSAVCATFLLCATPIGAISL